MNQRSPSNQKFDVYRVNCSVFIFKRSKCITLLKVQDEFRNALTTNAIKFFQLVILNKLCVKRLVLTKNRSL